MIDFIERDTVIGLKHEEVAKKYQELVDNYKKEVEGMPVEQLHEEEKKIMEVMDKWDKVLADLRYDLPKEVANPDGLKVSKNAVGKYIGEMLNKVECEFQYTLGYYQLFMFWKQPGSSIPYHTLDSTLTVLGSGLRFRGPEQWVRILTINEYFKPLHEKYSIDNMTTYLYSMCHNAVLDRLNIEAPAEVPTEEVPEPVEGQPVGDPVA